ncbi:MAG: hypothetical protein AAF761_06365, partial [Pseudomonadota bacterium]
AAGFASLGGGRTRLLLETTVFAGAAMILVLASPPPQTLAPGRDTGAAVIAVALLFGLAGVVLTHRYRSWLLSAFWAALLVVAMFGVVALAKLTFGQDMARYVNLFHRHLGVLGLIAAGAVWFASLSPGQIVRAARSILFLVSRDSIFTPFSILFGALPLFAALLILLPDLLAQTPPVIGFFTESDGADVQMVVRFGLLTVVVLSAWVLFRTGPKWRRAHQEREGTKSILHRPIPVLSGWFLAPSLGLAAVVFVTPETGILGLQPSELTKTWLAFLFALLLARAVEAGVWRMPFDADRSRLGLLLTCVVLALFFAAGSAVNFDLSPAAIVLMMTLGMGVIMFLEWLRERFSPSVAALAFVAAAASLWVVGGRLHWSDGIVLLALALFLWPVITRFSQAQRGHLSPWLLRSPAARSRRRNWLQSIAARFEGRGRRTAFAVVTGISVLFGTLWAADDLRKLADIESYQDYDIRVLNVPLPNTPLERVLSYLDARLTKAPGAQAGPLVEYPDLSLQVRESREIVAATGCGLSGSLDQVARALLPQNGDAPGLSARASASISGASTQLDALCNGREVLFPKAGPLDSAILDLPAVQDDFAPALLVAVLGVDGARVVLLAQVVMVAAIITLCLTISQQVRQLSNFRGIGLLGAIFLGNLCFVYVAQITLSWSNMLGLLPVVGQPMTFVSLGASHHLFFAFPLVFSTLLCVALIRGLDDASRPRREVITGGSLVRHVL